MSDVLVVEDDLLIADLLKAALEADGYNVSGVARTVAEGKESAERHPPNFAVIDIRLADGNLGTELGAYLRNTTRTGHCVFDRKWHRCGAFQVKWRCCYDETVPVT